MKAWPPITAARVDAEARMGEMLRSAIHRGALLDRRWWTPWLVAVQRRVTYDGVHLCVDMLPRDGVELALGRPRRWFADPLTRLLILQWHHDELECPPGSTPARCLGAFRGAGRVPTDEAMDGLASRARETWKLQIPGVLCSYAAGEVLSFSTPGQTWRRMAFGCQLPDASDDHAARYERAIERRKRARRFPSTLMSEERRALGEPQGGRKPLAWKRHVADALLRLPPPSGAIQGDLRQWLVHGLRYGPGRHSKGYSPATLVGYVRELARVFAPWSDSDFVNATPAQLRELFTSYLEDRANSEDDTPIKAMLAFARFRDAEGGEGLALELDEYWSEKPGAADLVTPSTYARALAILDASADEDAALLLILAFRTGARLNELRALRVGDLALSPAGFELVIESNPARLLKTPTSRRIVPLDVLLEKAERGRVERRLAERRIAGGSIAEAWLFGPPLNVCPPGEAEVEKVLTAALVQASGSSSITAGHLRHSFVSFLLATLMLPRDVEHPAIPEELSTVISRKRFDEVANRLLGAERIGAGAVHAVSQLVGHTGPAMTLRYYCHLLDFILGLYVSRPPVMRPIADEWFLAKLKVGPDAIRKARSRNRVDRFCPMPLAQHKRPVAAELMNAAPAASEGAALVALLDAAAMKVGRGMRRQHDADVRGCALWKETGPIPERLSRELRGATHRPSRPWAAIVTALADQKPDAATLEIDDVTLERWRAARRPRVVELVQAWCPVERELIQMVDERLHVTRPLRRAERDALRTIRLRWFREARDIKVKRLREAKAFVALLSEMGFSRDEVVLEVTGRRGDGFSSADLHDFFDGRGRALTLSGRAGWRGSLAIRLVPRDHRGSRAAADAARFAVLMMAIDADRP